MKMFLAGVLATVVFLVGCAVGGDVQAAGENVTNAFRLTDTNDSGWYTMSVEGRECIVKHSTNGWGGAYAISCDWSQK